MAKAYHLSLSGFSPAWLAARLQRLHFSSSAGVLTKPGIYDLLARLLRARRREILPAVIAACAIRLMCRLFEWAAVWSLDIGIF